MDKENLAIKMEELENKIKSLQNDYNVKVANYEKFLRDSDKNKQVNFNN